MRQVHIRLVMQFCRSVELNSWEYVPDHRGETVYSTENGRKVTISDIGEYPENTTTIARFRIWCIF